MTSQCETRLLLGTLVQAVPDGPGGKPVLAVTDRGGVLIRDICGDLYTIPDPSALAPAGRARVEALME